MQRVQRTGNVWWESNAKTVYLPVNCRFYYPIPYSLILVLIALTSIILALNHMGYEPNNAINLPVVSMLE